MKANKQSHQWKAQIKYNTPLNGRSTSNQTHRDKTRSQIICENYTKGLKCFHGHNCSYRHPPLAQAHVAATEEEIYTCGTLIPNQWSGFSILTTRDVMIRLSVQCIHYHIFNLQQHFAYRSSLVRSNLTVEGTTFKSTVMLDSGCSTCIIPISRLPEDVREHMTRSDTLVKGINGSIRRRKTLNSNLLNSA